MGLLRTTMVHQTDLFNTKSYGLGGRGEIFLIQSPLWALSGDIRAAPGRYDMCPLFYKARLQYRALFYYLDLQHRGHREGLLQNTDHPWCK
jgi:hypothetical protein